MKITALLLSLSLIVSVLGLLPIGIHNVWDTVTHIVVVRINGDAEE